MQVACPQMSSCSLFPLFQRQEFLRVWQSTYCEGDFRKCARYQQALCGAPVPETMLPNGKSLALPRKPA